MPNQIRARGLVLRREIACASDMPAFRPDNLHPQARGYDIWGEAVLPKLSELLK